MGSINLTLNIDRVDLIIACCVVIIAVICFIWMLIWMSRIKKQNKALMSIEEKLGPVKCTYAEAALRDCEKRIRSRNEGARLTENKVWSSEYKEAKLGNTGNKMIEETENPIEVKSDSIDEEEQISEENIAIDENNQQEVDVLAEIRQMLIETEKNPQLKTSMNNDRYSRARSGKEYTKEELDNLIEF